MPDTRLSDRFAAHLNRVETLAAAGIPAPKEWQTVHDTFDGYRRLPLTAAERLANALTNPAKGDDIPTLHALALAEATNPGIQAQVDNKVAAVIEARLRELYAPAAQANYAKAAARFNEAAQAFTDAATTVDIETTDARDVAAMPDDQRAAWSAAEQLVAQLDAAVPILTVAAEVAGVNVDSEDGSLLTLCVDPTDMHRRDLWQAWVVKDGRCHRWAALTKINARIRAAAELGDITPYRKPRDIEYRQVPVPGRYGIYETKAFDPEDPNYRPAEPERVMIPGRMLVR